MLIASNIDRTDEAYNTTYPFTTNCALNIGGSTLLPGTFLGIKVYCTPSMPPPVRLASVLRYADDPGGARLLFSSGSEAFFGSLTIYSKTSTAITTNVGQYISTFIRNANGIIVGHAMINVSSVGFWEGVLNKSDEVLTDADDFILLPQCHVPLFDGSMRSVSVNGTTMLGDVTIKCGKYTRTSQPNDDAYSISMIGPYHQHNGYGGTVTLGLDSCNKSSAQIHDMEAETLPIDRDLFASKAYLPLPMTYSRPAIQPTEQSSIWVGGKHLVIRAAKNSNLRVTTVGNTITIGGVRGG